MKSFYDAIRPMFGGKLSQSQVQGIEALLAATAGLHITHRAYLLATAKHETNDTMQPITEYGGRKYFDKYDTGKLANALGNTPEADGDGFKYRGRGYAQITGRDNYEKFGIANTPDKALEPELAAYILVRGCEDGMFTRKKLSDYLPGDYKQARRVVNGMDDAGLIAGYAEVFESALAALPLSPKPVVDSPAPDAGGNWLARLIRAIFGPKNSA